MKLKHSGDDRRWSLKAIDASSGGGVSTSTFVGSLMTKEAFLAFWFGCTVFRRWWGVIWEKNNSINFRMTIPLYLWMNGLSTKMGEWAFRWNGGRTFWSEFPNQTKRFGRWQGNCLSFPFHYPQPNGAFELWRSGATEDYL